MAGHRGVAGTSALERVVEAFNFARELATKTVHKIEAGIRNRETVEWFNVRRVRDRGGECGVAGVRVIGHVEWDLNRGLFNVKRDTVSKRIQPLIRNSVSRVTLNSIVICGSSGKNGAHVVLSVMVVHGIVSAVVMVQHQDYRNMVFNGCKDARS